MSNQSDQIEQLPKMRRTPGAEPVEIPPVPPSEAATNSANDASPEAAIPLENGGLDIRLLEETLVVDRSHRKVGEVIVRKEIETRMVEVPVRREKLIVEQVGSEPRRLGEVLLSDPEIAGVELVEMTGSQTEPIVRAEFNSAQTASQLLKAIASQPHHGCTKVRLELVVEDSKLQETYQKWLDRYLDS